MLTAVIALLGLSIPAAASDLGTEAHFDVRPAGRVLYSFPNSGNLADDVVTEEIKEPFDTVLVQGECAGGRLVFEMRRRPSGGSWGSWRSIAADRWTGEGRFWARFSFAGPPAAGTLELRQSAAAGFPACSPEIRSIEAYSSGDDHDDANVPVQPRPVFPSELHIHSRKEWDAQPPKFPPIPAYPKFITQHHTAGVCASDAETASKREMQFLQDLHQNGRGWSDIGYHFVIDCAGNIFEGRDLSSQGAHVRGHNSDNIGIALMGYYHPPHNDRVNDAQLRALTRLAVWLSQTYGIPRQVYQGHRFYNPETYCPGDNMIPVMDKVRQALEGQAASLNRIRSKTAESAMTFERWMNHPFAK